VIYQEKLKIVMRVFHPELTLIVDDTRVFVARVIGETTQLEFQTVVPPL
jgi:hypothetical protein